RVSFYDRLPTVITPLSLHDALPIWRGRSLRFQVGDRTVYARRVNHPGTPARPYLATALVEVAGRAGFTVSVGRNVTSLGGTVASDRKSTRLNSSHVKISYAVFCLKK